MGNEKPILSAAEFVAGNAWKAYDDKNGLAPLQEDLRKRKFVVRAGQAVLFEKILDHHLLVDREMKGPTPEPDPFSESLTGVLKAFKRRKVYARSETSRSPRFVSLILSGNQITDVFNFVNGMNEYQEISDIQRKIATSMTERLIYDFPTAQFVEEKGKIKNFVDKITRRKS